MKRHGFIQFIIIILLLTGAARAQKKSNPAPCNLLTQPEAEKIVGVKVRLRADDRIENEMQCYYAPDDEEGGVSLVLRVYPDRRQARGFFTGNRKLHANLCNGFKPLSGIGESAWMCRNGNSKDIAVLKNNFMFHLSVTAENLTTAELKRIARRIAAKL